MKCGIEKDHKHSNSYTYEVFFVSQQLQTWRWGEILEGICQKFGARGSVVGWGTNATIRKVAGSIPDEVIGFFNWPNPSRRTMALGSTQSQTEMSNRNLPGDKGRPACKTDLTAICEPNV
jgi:hypothetical protein